MHKPLSPGPLPRAGPIDRNRDHPPRKPLPPVPLQTSLERWKQRALEQEPDLAEAVWIRAVAYRVTDGADDAATDTQAYIEGIFHRGFAENPATVSVSGGMSTGGVASTKSWEGARKYLCAEGQFLFLVAAEGFYLPSIDRQNRSYEIMSHRIPGWQVLAGARVDEVESEYGQLFGLSTNSVCFNHGFRPPTWTDKEKLRKKLAEFIDKVGGIERVHRDEYKAVCRWLGIDPPLLDD